MQLKTLTYTSQAQLDITDRDVTDIHSESRNLNALDDITGLLIYDGVRFLQIVEGTEEAVDDLVGRLRRDVRHFGFQIRDERFVDERSFSNWSMNLIRVTEGFGEARTEVAPALPASTTPAVRNLVLRMTDDLASTG